LYKRPDTLFVPAHALPFIHPKRSVITIHDIGFERDRRLYQSEAMGPGGFRKRKILNFFVYLFTLGKYRANSIDYLRWSTAYALRKALRVITVSDFTRKEIEEFYRLDENKISVVHNGYNKYLYKPVNDKNKVMEVLARYGVEPPYIFYVGRIERKKNTPALIESFALMRESNKTINHKLVLVGDASYGYDETNYMIEQYRLDDEVIMPGWVDEEDLPFFYAGATAFIFPSFYEGFGIPLLQAMACDLPIAASWSSSIPEVVGEAALLFDPHNVAAMARAMAKIITDFELQNKLVVLGRAKISNYSWEKCARETLAVIDRDFSPADR
ncbi:MAG: glycosyltransferase family 4 protein, partial [Planctomycetes bacterium]|nr:glycosyltransferase family 4 protein [Planctomycetota bacterium]